MDYLCMLDPKGTRAITERDHIPTSALSQSRFWSQNEEWFSKGSSGQNCVHEQTNGRTDRHENCICTTSYTPQTLCVNFRAILAKI